MFKTKPSINLSSFYTQMLLLILLVFVSRLVSMWGVPLGDSTEARYGEIARLMVSSDDWVRLMHYPGQYFWAKPPLSTWLSAITMKTFGVSAFNARLPAWILSFICLSLVARMAFNQLYYKGAIWAIGILATTVFFQVDAGTVMTDPSLMTCVLIVMVGFWLRMQGEHWVWGYVTFIGWGLGLLAKGLVMGVFTVLPLAVWLSLNRQWKTCWQQLPWVKGTILTLSIAAPWYILAEMRMPGFLNYFIVGEHVMRYLKPGWTGDMFGHAHDAPIGMIWFYFILGASPWSIVLMIWKLRKKIDFKFSLSEKKWLSYLLCFTLMPLLFFTFARNIIYPYVFPTLPAFALIVTIFLLKVERDLKHRKELRLFFYGCVLVMMLSSFLYTWLNLYYPEGFSKSTDQMVATWKHHRQNSKEHLIYLHLSPEYSSMFYNQGQTLATRDRNTLCAWLKEGPQYLVLDSDFPSDFDASIKNQFTQIASIQHRNRIDTLYRIEHLPSFCK